MSIVEFMFAPFVACILLIGINIYFGIHVIKREIIFIDIAMAQIAALGTTVASILHFTNPEHGHEAEGIYAYLFAIGFTTIAALIFTFLKSRKLRIPLEALIGLAYAIAATGSVILLDKAAGGDVHVKEMVEGSILWVSWGKNLELFLVFAAIGIFHYIFRKRFTELTNRYTEDNHHHFLWDFLFYASFGITVVHAVKVGGILTVFAFLIIPASISALFTENWLLRILIGWSIGTVVTVCGLYLSWQKDMPTAPTVILFLGIFLLASLLVKMLSGLRADGGEDIQRTAAK